jgi:hypothetical protein
LQPDGVDDGLITPSIDFSGTNKITGFSATIKLNDAASGTIYEFGQSGLTTSLLRLLAPRTALAANYSVGAATASTFAEATASGFASPHSAVIRAFADSSVPSTQIAVNGSSAVSSSASIGAGNFGNHTITIGYRAGNTNYFNGQIFGIAIVGKTPSAEEIRLVKREMIKRLPQATLA